MTSSSLHSKTWPLQKSALYPPVSDQPVSPYFDLSRLLPSSPLPSGSNGRSYYFFTISFAALGWGSWGIVGFVTLTVGAIGGLLPVRERSWARYVYAVLVTCDL